MSDRDKINQYKSIKYAQESSDSKKEIKLFKILRKEVEIGANGTSTKKGLTKVCLIGVIGGYIGGS